MGAIRSQSLSLQSVMDSLLEKSESLFDSFAPKEQAIRTKNQRVISQPWKMSSSSNGQHNPYEDFVKWSQKHVMNTILYKTIKNLLYTV